MPSPAKPFNMWDELSRRCFGFNRDLLKRYAMMRAYSGATDPWIDHIIATELAQIWETTDNA